MGDTDREDAEGFWYKIPTYNDLALPRFAAVNAGLKDLLTAIRNLDTNASDILYCTFPKSGTNWIHEIIMMLMQGSTEYCNIHRYTRMLEGMTSMDQVAALQSPRFINTHVPFDYLPEKHIREGYRIINVIRNPKDVTVSMYGHFVRDYVVLSDQFPGSWEYFLKMVCDNKMKLYGGWFNYVRQFEEEQRKGNLRNVHTVFYEDMHQNPVHEIRRLAEFLKADCDDTMAAEIHRKCSFDNMFQHHETMEFVDKVKQGSLDGKTNFFFRKGVVGDWKNWFTVAQSEMFDAALKREMADTKLVFKYEI